MICPKCRNDMIVVEHRKIELDYCPNCEGVWFDAGELDLFLKSAGLAEPELTIQRIAGLPAIPASHKLVKCPMCRQPMKEVTAGQPAINLDVCPDAHGLWFDRGEVSMLLKQLAGKLSSAGGSPHSTFEFLGEVFMAQSETPDNGSGNNGGKL